MPPHYKRPAVISMFGAILKLSEMIIFHEITLSGFFLNFFFLDFNKLCCAVTSWQLTFTGESSKRLDTLLSKWFEL